MNLTNHASSINQLVEESHQIYQRSIEGLHQALEINK